MLRTRWPVAVFVVWSTYVWATRIVNALADGGPGTAFSVVLAATVLVPAVAVGVVLVRARQRSLAPPEVNLLRALAGWTALVWVVRGAEIVLSDHEPAFKIVHVALGVVSIALAAATVRVAGTAGTAGAPRGGPRDVSSALGTGR